MADSCHSILLPDLARGLGPPLLTLLTAQGSLHPGHDYTVMGCSTVFSAVFLSLTPHLAYASPATQALEELPLLWELSQTCYHRKEKAHTHSEQRDTLRLQSWGPRTALSGGKTVEVCGLVKYMMYVDSWHRAGANSLTKTGLLCTDASVHFY